MRKFQFPEEEMLNLFLLKDQKSVFYYASYLLYNIYFHPLSRFPGPKLWTSTVLTHSYYVAIGDLDERMREMHRYVQLVGSINFFSFFCCGSLNYSLEKIELEEKI